MYGHSQLEPKKNTLSKKAVMGGQMKRTIAGYPFILLEIDFVLTKRIKYRTLIILIFEIHAPFFSRNNTVMVNDWL